MITLEGWVLVMYNLQDATQAWIAVIYSILIVVVGSFFLLNVILAVITDSLERADEDMTKEEMRKNKQTRELKIIYYIDDSEDEISDLDLPDDQDLQAKVEESKKTLSGAVTVSYTHLTLPTKRIV